MVQKFNLPAVSTYLYARCVNNSLLVPHYSVKDINSIDAKDLREKGIKAVIFDKDDTLTLPYVNKKHFSVEDKIKDFKEHFGNNLMIVSNCAGVWGEDRGYKLAQEVKDQLGISVFKRFWKKP